MAVLALARRHLRGQGARAALTAAGVACGVALVVAIRVINASTLASFTDAIEDLAGSAALQVRGPGPFPEAVADELRAIPGVDHAVPIVTATFFGTEPPIAGEAFSVFAADVTDGHAIRTLHLVKAGEHVVDDPLGFLVDPRSVIVTDVLAARLGVTVGARLPLRTPHGIETFTVRGVLPPGGVGRAFGGGSASATSVAARRRELGILRCAGAERRQVAALVLGEALATGIVGAAGGVPLGIVLARLLLRSVTESTELIFSMTVFTARLEVSTWALAGGVATGVGAAVVAAWLPARDAALVSPLVAVRTAEGAHPMRRWQPRGTIVAAVLLTGGALWAETPFHSPWCGNVAALAADFALVLAFMRLAGRAAALFLRPARQVLGFAGRLAVDRLVRIPDQLALAAAVLALGLGLMMTAATVARSFEESVLDFIRRQVHADLVVASTATTGWIEAPLDEGVGDRLAAVPGVARVERVRLAEHAYRGARISIDSLDASAFAPEREADFSFAAGDPQAALAAVRASTGVLVSRNFARQFDVGVGATIRLDTPGGPFEARVVGVVVDYVSPRGSVILARPTYQRWWADRAVNRFHVTLAPGPSLDAVRPAAFAAVGAAQGVKVLTQRELYAYHQDAVRGAFRLTVALEILPLVVAALGLAEPVLAF